MQGQVWMKLTLSLETSSLSAGTLWTTAWPLLDQLSCPLWPEQEAVIAEITTLPGKWREGKTQLPLKRMLFSVGMNSASHQGTPQLQEWLGSSDITSGKDLEPCAERPDQMQAAQQHLPGPQKMKKFLVTGQKTSMIIPLESYGLNTKVKDG